MNVRQLFRRSPRDTDGWYECAREIDYPFDQWQLTSWPTLYNGHPMSCWAALALVQRRDGSPMYTMYRWDGKDWVYLGFKRDLERAKVVLAAEARLTWPKA